MSEIFVGVDTNILCNFGHIERLDWKTLFPHATSVTILVSAKVQAEMDVHKDTASGYLLKRAREFQRLLKKAEEQDYCYSIEDCEVPVNFVFLNRPRAHELDQQQFDLEHADERIVAEYHFEQKRLSVEICIVANDARPIRVARDAHMRALRPEKWEADRSEPEDEKLRTARARIRELERAQGARPKTQLANFSTERRHVIPSGFSPTFDVAKYLTQMGSALRNTETIRSPQSLIDKYGIDDGFFGALNTRHLTDNDIRDYVHELEEYYTRFNFEPHELLRRLQVLGAAYVLTIEIENVGEAPEEIISLELSLQNAIFVEPSDMEGFNDWCLAPPTPPVPAMWLADDVLLSDQSGSPWEAEHEFASLGGSVTTETHRCRSMLHGHKAKTESYIHPSDPAKPITVLVTLRAKNLIDPITRKLEIICSPEVVDEAFVDDFLVRQSVFLEDDQREILLAVLEER
ncbi:hypothetical protein [Ensifer sp. B1-9]|uniref:hypothetical protein n=1 Tax=Ensifer sp. B1-9 TaxID=3141455 RepID=UPI003D1A1BCE